MALKDALKIETSKKPGPRCSICILVPTLPKSDAEALNAAFADAAVTSSAISRALYSD